MKNGLLIGVGVLVTLAGLIFSLQGFNAMTGAAMSGSSTWKVLGPIIAIVGLIILGLGLRAGGWQSGKDRGPAPAADERRS